jgi:hypothetical protein
MVAYYEAIRDRQTGSCEECGRLNYATNRCLCGGRVTENDLLEETRDDVALNDERVAVTSADSHRLLALLLIALLTGCGVWIGVDLPTAVWIGLLGAGAWVAWLLTTTYSTTNRKLDL